MTETCHEAHRTGTVPYPDPLLRFRPHIEAALAYADDTYGYDDVAQMVMDGSCQAWPGEQSVVITEIMLFPRKKVLNIFLAGGNLNEIEAMTPLILQWGKEQGCEAATFTGRRGWARTYLTKQGWSESLVMFAKRL